MEKNPTIQLKEVIYGSADKKINRQISKLHGTGRIRKIASRLYTSNLTEPEGVIIRRNLFEIIEKLYPGAMLSHRSAFEFKPTDAGHIFLTYKYTKKIQLPGITFRFLEGPGPIEGDNPFSGDLYVSQQARAFLENLQLSKRPGPTSKTLTIPEIEEKLEQIVRINGEDELNRVRDRTREISVKLDMEREFSVLESIIGALLSTRISNILSSPLAAARAFGVPYDPGRLELFEELFRDLQTKEFRNRPDKNLSVQSFRNVAFFESYFSNYIEGTEFEIEEAMQIIESNQPLPARNNDSHDILGTYRILSSKQEMSITPGSADELLSILQARHRILLSVRTDKKPGLFKDRNNVAGRTSFVDMNLVKGTLIKSYDLYRALTHPFKRAAFVMFVISEVHPFLDGNGRMARIMMNAELVSEGQSKIIIPTVYRDDYLGVLRKLTRQRETGSYIRMLFRAYDFSETVFGEDIHEMQQYLENCNAFLEPTEGKLEI
ncbi:MAG: Fic family protein [Bacteroidales bacterium]|nr:Fic family protein [Bacteroidales bacterium]